MPSQMTARERRFEMFETPPHYVAALFNEVNIFGRVYEPCVGDGAISRHLMALPSVRKVITNDLNEDCVADHHVDAAFGLPSMKPCDWVVTNPPFSLEREIVENSMAVGSNLAFLARLSFLEPVEDREHFLSSHPPNQVIVLPRYSFRPPATDNMTCAWLVWFADHQPRPMKFYSRGAAQAAAVIRGLSE